MLYKDPSPKKLKEARIKTYEKEIKTMLEEEFLQRRTFHDSYSPYMMEKILQIGEQGGGRSQMMKAIGVRTVNTFQRWMDDNDEFREAYLLAQVYCQAYLEEQLLNKSTGLNPDIDVKALSLLMSSRFPEYKKEVSNTKVEFNVTNNSLEQLPDSVLNDRIQQQIKSLGFSEKSDISDGIIIEHDSPEES